jgi:hypothetical protein
VSFKVTKLTVGKGKTTGDEKQGEWIKRYYEIEVSIEDEHDTEIAKASAEGLIDGWLTGIKIVEPQTQMAKQEMKSEELSRADLAKLPWKSYQTKQDAKQDEAAWIFANTKGAEVLLADLKTRNKVQIGSFEYTFSGKERQFISRKPLKEKKT